jgi:hypothetical protein
VRVASLREFSCFERGMAIQVRTTGCLFSILASIVLTILLNLMIRGCSG